MSVIEVGTWHNVLSVDMYMYMYVLYTHMDLQSSVTPSAQSNQTACHELHIKQVVEVLIWGLLVEKVSGGVGGEWCVLLTWLAMEATSLVNKV